MCPRPRAHAYPAATIGTAFDYLARFSLDALGDPRELAAWRGATEIATPELRDALFRETGPRACFAFALFEETWRAGARAWERSPLRTYDPADGVEGLLALAPRACVDDLTALGRAFDERASALLPRPIVGNPSFAGSADVYGADADLLAGSCLVDLKTVASPALQPEWIWQLAGYVLLDYDDAHGIESVALYLARHARLIRFDVRALLARLSGDPAATVPALRADLRTLLDKVK